MHMQHQTSIFIASFLNLMNRSIIWYLIERIYINVIAIAPRLWNSYNIKFMILRNSRSLLKCLLKHLILMWYMENEFSRSFSTLQGTSAWEKYDGFTASYLLLKKFMSWLLSSLSKIYWESKGLKMFSYDFAVFLIGMFSKEMFRIHLQKVLIL